MSKMVIFVDLVLPRAAPKPRQEVYVRFKLPVEIGEVLRADTDAAARVELPSASWNNQATEVDIISHDGKYWRPVSYHVPWNRQDGYSGEEVLRQTDNTDNPIWVAATAEQSQRTGNIPEGKPGDVDPERLEVAIQRVVEAAQSTLLIDGVAFRQCHEPTWVVTSSWNDEAILVQPDLGSPGNRARAAWFRGDRQEHALTFAEQLSELEGKDMHFRGRIQFEPGYAPAFDDVRHAQKRLTGMIAKGGRTLHGAVPRQLANAAEDVAGLAADNLSAGAEAALEVLSKLEEHANHPAAAAMIGTCAYVAPQLDYFTANAIFSNEDEDALDSAFLSSPKP